MLLAKVPLYIIPIVSKLLQVSTPHEIQPSNIQYMYDVQHQNEVFQASLL